MARNYTVPSDWDSDIESENSSHSDTEGLAVDEEEVCFLGDRSNHNVLAAYTGEPEVIKFTRKT